ncbi:MAG: LamG domain-containing protein [Candidatus Brocadiae bacterium]|nr:LamG domain-containing protein [Candidatus Brocadiia bacterium]
MSIKKFCISSAIFLFFLYPSLQAALVGYYNFNQSSGSTLPDLSTMNNNGTLVNMPNNWAAGQSGYGNALNFNNANQYVSIGNNSSLAITDAITVSAWIKMDFVQHAHIRIVEKHYTSSWYFGTGANGGNSLSVYINNASRIDTGGSVFSLNQWTHVAFTYDRQYARIYVNGVQQGAGAYTGAIGLDANDVWIGNWKGLSHNFNGMIDEVTIWNEALNASQISQLQTSAFIPEPASIFYVGFALFLSLRFLFRKT